MRVLHVIPSVSEHSGGPAQAIGPMCQALQKQGIDVVIATTDDEVEISEFEFTNGHSGLPPQYTIKGVPTHFFPVQWGGSFKYSRSMAGWLDTNVARFDVVHIHAVFNHACLAAARACRKHDVPYIVRPLGTLDPWSMKQKSLRKSVFWKLAAKRMLTDASVVHYTSRAEREATESSLGLSDGAIVPLGIDAEAVNSCLGQEGFEREFPELASHPYVLVLSRLHPKKGLDVLLKAFLSLQWTAGSPAWRLVLAGDGPAEYIAELKAIVSEHNAERVVFFPGWLSAERKNAVLHRAGLLALPSYQENFGVCVMEAMACGVPVLVSPHVSLSNEISAAGAGWVVGVDVEELRTTLAEVVGSPEQRHKRGQAGRTVSESFTWEKVATALHDVYASILPIRALREASRA